MATRFYLSTGHAADLALSRPVNGSALWDSNVTSLPTTRKLSLSTRGTANNANAPYGRATVVGNGTNPNDILWFQGISGPLAAQTISGTFLGVACFRESATNTNANTQAGVYVVNAAGTVVATLYGGQTLTGAQQELNNPSANSREIPATSLGGAVNLTSYACADGDRIVVEIGVRLATTRMADSVYAYIGDPGGSDLPTGNGASNNLTINPWVEFSATLTFGYTATGSFTANAVIKKPDVAGSFTADAVVASGASEQTGSFTADAVVFKADNLRSFTADSVKRIVDIGGSFTADAVISTGGGAGSITADAVKLATATGTLGADAVKLATVSSAIPADAVKLAGQSGSLPANAVIARTVSGSFQTDALIKAIGGGSLLADSVLLATLARSLAADAITTRTVSGSLTVDALMRIVRSATITGDAWFLRVQTGQLIAAAVLQDHKSATITANAVFRDTRTAGFVASALVLSPRTQTFPADAVVLRPVAGSLSADSLFYAAVNGDFTADAVIVLRMTEVIGSVLVVEELTYQLGSDHLDQELTTARLTFAVKQTYQRSFTADAVIV